jgi:heme exporter protein C
MILFLGFAIVFGSYLKLEKARPTYWKLVAVLIIFTASVFTILPPLAGNFPDARMVASLEQKNIIDLSLVIESNSLIFNESRNAYYGQAYYPKHIFEKEKETKKHDIKIEDSTYKKLQFDKEILVKAFFIPEANLYKIVDLIQVEPSVVYPYVPALMQRIRNLNYHVPMAWIAVIAFCVSMIFSIKYLRTNDELNDLKASSAAGMGLFFSILATTTGMIWAKFNWGSFWNNDPRQVTILFQIIIYLSYFVLRSSIDEETKKARLSSVYSIFAFLSVPLLTFIIPRQFASLHPGAQDDGTTGPVVDPQSGMLDSALALSYYISLAGFIIIFFWLLSINVRYRFLNRKLEFENV